MGKEGERKESQSVSLNPPFKCDTNKRCIRPHPNHTLAHIYSLSRFTLLMGTSAHHHFTTHGHCVSQHRGRTRQPHPVIAKLSPAPNFFSRSHTPPHTDLCTPTAKICAAKTRTRVCLCAYVRDKRWMRVYASEFECMCGVSY